MSNQDSFYSRQKQNPARRETTEKKYFEVPVVGVTFDNRQQVVKTLRVNDTVTLRRDPHNSHDSNAIRVDTQNGKQIGFISRDLAAVLAPAFDRIGKPISGTVTARVGGELPGSSHGIRIRFAVATAADARSTGLPNLEDEL